MKINKGIIKNINKKLLAGALALTLVTTPLIGCSKSSYEYVTNEQGMYELSGTINYESLRTYCFLVIDNPDYDKVEYYIVRERRGGGIHIPVYVIYENIINNQQVFIDNANDSNRKILVSTKLEDYLYASGNVKTSYTKEDIEEILNQMIEIYENQNNKQLVKE